MARVVRLGSELALVLSKEALAALEAGEGSELELSVAKKGIVLVTGGEKTAAVPAKEAEKKAFFPPEELALLKKLDSFKFADRVVTSVNRTLTVGERKTLDGLLRKRMVTVFKGEKYAKAGGVYNIPRQYYPLVRQAKQAVQEEKQAKPALVSQAHAPAPKSAAPLPLSSLAHLEKFGFMIVEREDEAKRISVLLEKQVKAGEIVGTRGFDRKFYLARKPFYVETSEAVRRLLKLGEKTISHLSAALKSDENRVRVVLEIMNDEGEVIEKKRGFYQLC